MKRNLSVEHLLYNARNKPEYVRAWLLEQQGKQLRHPHWTHRQENTLAKKTWQEFVEGDKPRLHEFDFQGDDRPVLTKEIFGHDGRLTLAFSINCSIAFRQDGKRALNLRRATLVYDMASKRYRIDFHGLILDVWKMEDGVKLTFADREALDLMVESVMLTVPAL